jgi:HlyD family secretion protein
MSKKTKMLFFILTACSISLGIYFIRHHSGSSSFQHVSGIVEAPEVNVSSMIPGRIVSLKCREGDTVEKGAVLIGLEHDELKAVVNQAEAQLERSRADILVARSAVKNAEASIDSIRAEIRSAQAGLDKTLVLLADADREKTRYSGLLKDQAVSVSSYDSIMTAYKAALAESQSAKARLSQAKAKLESTIAQKESAESQKAVAEAGLKQSEAGLALAKAKLEQTVITSPLSGTVVYKALEEGEAVSPGMTILTLVNLNRLSVRIDVEETHIHNLTIHQEVAIRAQEGRGDAIHGKIAAITPYAEFATQKDVTRGRQDIKTFKVIIHVDSPSGMLKPGMTVDVAFPGKGGL